MAFETWSESGIDAERRKRLLLGGFIGVVAVTGGIAGIVLSSSRAEAEVEDEEKVVEVQLATPPEPEPEPDPTPPPPPPPDAKPRAPRPGPKLPKLDTPTEISKEAVTEKEVADTGGGEDPFQRGGGDGAPGAAPAVVEPAVPAPAPKPPPPKVKKPVPVTEGMTPPESIGDKAKPEYPADAKAAGIEGTVVVRYVVDERGNVTDVRAVKGPPELHAVCVAAVKAMRFKPALDADGKPVAVVRYFRFPFRLRT